jgi:hypothetical protein
MWQMGKVEASRINNLLRLLHERVESRLRQMRQRKAVRFRERRALLEVQRESLACDRDSMPRMRRDSTAGNTRL